MNKNIKMGGKNDIRSNQTLERVAQRDGISLSWATWSTIRDGYNFEVVPAVSGVLDQMISRGPLQTSYLMILW